MAYEKLTPGDQVVLCLEKSGKERMGDLPERERERERKKEDLLQEKGGNKILLKPSKTNLTVVALIRFCLKTLYVPTSMAIQKRNKASHTFSFLYG